MTKTRDNVLNRMAAMLGLVNALGQNNQGLTIEDIDTLDKPPAAKIEAMAEALREIKFRLYLDGWPGERMWNAGTEEKPHWIADWRYEIDLLEHALNGTPRQYSARPNDTRRRCSISTRERTGPQLRMTYQEARKHLGTKVGKNGRLDEDDAAPYLHYSPGDPAARLDGHFDADTLEAICAYMHEHESRARNR